MAHAQAQFKVGDRVTFKADEKRYARSHGMSDPFVIAEIDDADPDWIVVRDAHSRGVWVGRLEHAPAPALGQESYEKSLATLRSVGAVFREQPPTWAELPQADRDAWDRCCACLADKIEPPPAPAAQDSADRFTAQAHAFAVTSGEQRETILALAKALVREMER